MKKHLFVVAIVGLLVAAFLIARPDPTVRSKPPSDSPSLVEVPAAEDPEAPTPGEFSEEPTQEEVAPPPPRTEPSPSTATIPVQELHDLFSQFRSLRLDAAKPWMLESLQGEIRERLEKIAPEEVTTLLALTEDPASRFPILERIDEGLRENRALWEESLVHALRQVADDAVALAELSEFALDRLRIPEARGDAARLLMERACNDRLTLLAGRFADGDAFEEVSEFLWSKAPTDAAVEALGFVIFPDEAERLKELGGTKAVEYALEIARTRTGDESFRTEDRDRYRKP